MVNLSKLCNPFGQRVEPRRARRGHPVSRIRCFRAGLEQLEPRLMLAMLSITKIADTDTPFPTVDLDASETLTEETFTRFLLTSIDNGTVAFVGFGSVRT